MNSTVEIDEIDVKILLELIKDARARLKDIAKACGITSSAISTRIAQLKIRGVVTGAVQFFNMEHLGYLLPASIGIKMNPHEEARVIKLMKENPNTIAVSPSIGKYDLTVFLVAQCIRELEGLKQVIRKQEGVRKISISLWSTPHFNLENIDLTSNKR